MSKYLKFCPNCRKHFNENDGIEEVYLPWLYDDDYECPECESKIIDTKITVNEFSAIQDISNTIGFLEAMIKLKETNPIEYQLKLSQFRAANTQTQKSSVSSNQVKCPKCSSTNIQMVNRKWSFLRGFATNKVDRVCVNCKHKF